jgi:alcohol dehydrogenase class IV
MLLPAVTRFGLDAAAPRYAAASRAAGFAAVSDDDAAAGMKLCHGLNALNRELQVPTPQAYGIAWGEWEAAMDVMADQAIASGSPANNPRVPDKAEIVGLYRQVFAGSNE